MSVSECCLMKLLLSYILFENYIYILAVEMASPGNRHCASCIGTVYSRQSRKRACAVGAESA